MEDYEALLKQGMSRIRRAEVKERLEVPKASIMPSGQRTVITNFIEIASVLRREPYHLLKFLAKVLATFGEIKGKSVEFIGTFSADMINRRIEQYIKAFVTCPECGRPDTKILKEGKFNFMKCEACGARHPIEKV